MFLHIFRNIQQSEYFQVLNNYIFFAMQGKDFKNVRGVGNKRWLL